MANGDNRRDASTDSSRPEEQLRQNRESAAQTLMDFVLAQLATEALTSPAREPVTVQPTGRRSTPWFEDGSSELYRPDGTRIGKSATGRTSDMVIARQPLAGQLVEYAIGIPSAPEPLARLRYHSDGGRQVLSLSTSSDRQPYLTIDRATDRNGNGSYQIRFPGNGEQNIHEQQIDIRNGSLAAFNGTYTIPGVNGDPVRWEVSCTLRNKDEGPTGSIGEIRYQRSDNAEMGESVASGVLHNMLSEAIFQSVRTVAPWISRSDLFIEERAASSSGAGAGAASAWQELIGRLRGASADTASDTTTLDDNPEDAQPESHTESDTMFISHVNEPVTEREVPPPSREEFIERFQSRAGFAAFSDTDLLDLPPEQLNAALAYRVLHDPANASAAMTRLRLEAGRESNSSASEWYLNLATMMASERLNSAPTDNERRAALLDLGRLRLSQFHYLDPNNSAYQQIDDILRMRGTEGASALLAAGAAHGRDRLLAERLMTNCLANEDGALRARSAAALTRLAENGHGGIIQAATRAHDQVALRQLADTLRKTPPNNDELIASLLMLRHTDINLQQRVLTALGSDSPQPPGEQSPFASMNALIAHLQGDTTARDGRTPSPRLDPNAPAAIQEIAIELAPVAGSASDIITAGATDNAEVFSDLTRNEADARRASYEGFSEHERPFLAPGASSEERARHLEGMRLFLSGERTVGGTNPHPRSALRDRSLPLDFADLEAVQSLSRLHDATTPAEMSAALAHLRDLSIAGNERAGLYIDALTRGTTGDAVARAEHAMRQLTEETQQAAEMERLRTNLPALENELDALRTRAATRSFDFEPNPSAATLSATREYLQARAATSESARRALATVEVMSVAEELTRREGAAPSAQRQTELIEQLRAMLGSDLHRDEARRTLLELAAASGTPTHRNFVDGIYGPQSSIRTTPIDISHLPTADRENLSTSAMRVFEAHLRADRTEPLSEREAMTLALVTASNNTAIRSAATTLLERSLATDSGRVSALNATFWAMQVAGANTQTLSRLYRENVRSIPPAHFDVLARNAANGDTLAMDMMFAAASGLAPQELQSRARQVILDRGRHEPARSELVRSMLGRIEGGASEPSLFALLGHVTARNQTPLDANLQQQVLQVLRTQVGRSNGEVTAAWLATYRNWGTADGALAYDVLGPEEFANLNASQNVRNAYLTRSREYSDSPGGRLPYLAGLRLFANQATEADLQALSRLSSLPASGTEFSTALASAYLSIVSNTANQDLRRRAFEQFSATGLVGRLGLERETEVLRSYAASGAVTDLQQLEQLLTSRYDLGIRPPLALVMARLGVETNGLGESAAEIVSRLGQGGESGEAVARQTLTGFQLFSMMPPELRQRMLRDYNSAQVERYLPHQGQSAATTFVRDLRSGALTGQELQFFTTLQSRILEVERELGQDLHRTTTEIATEQQRAILPLLSSITDSSRTEFRNRMHSQRAANPYPIDPNPKAPTGRGLRSINELHDIEGISSEMPTDNALRASQVDAIVRRPEVRQQLRALSAMHSTLESQLNVVAGLADVARHQSLLHAGNLRAADHLALAASSQNRPSSARYFSEQLTRGTGAAGSASALTRLHASGNIASASLPTYGNLAEATAGFRAVPPDSSERTPEALERNRANALMRRHALTAIMRSPDAVAIQDSMRTVGDSHFVELMQAALQGRRTPELIHHLSVQARVVEGALSQITLERCATLRPVLEQLRASDDPSAREYANAMLGFIDTATSQSFRDRLALLSRSELNPTATDDQQFRNDLIKIGVCAVTTALIVGTGGTYAAVALPVLNYVASGLTEEGLRYAGLDPTNRGNVWGAYWRERLEIDSNGNIRPVSFRDAASETGMQLGMDYAGYAASRLTVARATACARRAGLHDTTLHSSTEASRWAASAAIAPRPQHFLRRFGIDVAENLGVSATMVGAQHAAEVNGLTEMGAGLLYDFVRTVASRRHPPAAIAINGDRNAVVSELHRAGLLDSRDGQLYVRIGDHRIRIVEHGSRSQVATDSVRIQENSESGQNSTDATITTIEREGPRSAEDLALQQAARTQSAEFGLHHNHSGAIPDGFIVGGSGRSVDATSTVTGGVAPVVVNRGADTTLRNTIEAAQRRLDGLTGAARVEALSHFVAEVCGPWSTNANGPDARVAQALYMDFLNRNSGRPMMLGEFIQAGVGGSREQALLFHLLGTEPGMLPPDVSVTMRRGNGHDTTDAINHSWNDVVIGTTRVIVDSSRGVHGRVEGNAGFTYRAGETMPESARLGMVPPSATVTPGEQVDYRGSNGWRIESTSADGKEVTLVHDAARRIPPNQVRDQIRSEGGRPPQTGEVVQLRRADGQYEGGWVVSGTDRNGNLVVSRESGVRITVPREQLTRNAAEQVGAPERAPVRADAAPSPEPVRTESPQPAPPAHAGLSQRAQDAGWNEGNLQSIGAAAGGGARGRAAVRELAEAGLPLDYLQGMNASIIGPNGPANLLAARNALATQITNGTLPAHISVAEASRLRDSLDTLLRAETPSIRQLQGGNNGRPAQIQTWRAQVEGFTRLLEQVMVAPADRAARARTEVLIRILGVSHELPFALPLARLARPDFPTAQLQIYTDLLMQMRGHTPVLDGTPNEAAWRAGLSITRALEQSPNLNNWAYIPTQPGSLADLVGVDGIFFDMTNGQTRPIDFKKGRRNNPASETGHLQPFEMHTQGSAGNFTVDPVAVTTSFLSRPDSCGFDSSRMRDAFGAQANNFPGGLPPLRRTADVALPTQIEQLRTYLTILRAEITRRTAADSEMSPALLRLGQGAESQLLHLTAQWQTMSRLSELTAGLTPVQTERGLEYRFREPLRVDPADAPRFSNGAPLLIEGVTISPDGSIKAFRRNTGGDTVTQLPNPDRPQRPRREDNGDDAFSVTFSIGTVREAHDAARSRIHEETANNLTARAARLAEVDAQFQRFSAASTTGAGPSAAALTSGRDASNGGSSPLATPRTRPPQRTISGDAAATNVVPRETPTSGTTGATATEPTRASANQALDRAIDGARRSPDDQLNPSNRHHAATVASYRALIEAGRLSPSTIERILALPPSVRADFEMRASRANTEAQIAAVTRIAQMDPTHIEQYLSLPAAAHSVLDRLIAAGKIDGNVFVAAPSNTAERNSFLERLQRIASAENCTPETAARFTQMSRVDQDALINLSTGSTSVTPAHLVQAISAADSPVDRIAVLTAFKDGRISADQLRALAGLAPDIRTNLSAISPLLTPDMMRSILQGVTANTITSADLQALRTAFLSRDLQAARPETLQAIIQMAPNLRAVVTDAIRSNATRRDQPKTDLHELTQRIGMLEDYRQRNLLTAEQAVALARRAPACEEVLRGILDRQGGLPAAERIEAAALSALVNAAVSGPMPPLQLAAYQRAIQLGLLSPSDLTHILGLDAASRRHYERVMALAHSDCELGLDRARQLLRDRNEENAAAATRGIAGIETIFPDTFARDAFTTGERVATADPRPEIEVTRNFLDAMRRGDYAAAWAVIQGAPIRLGQGEAQNGETVNVRSHPLSIAVGDLQNPTALAALHAQMMEQRHSHYSEQPQVPGGPATGYLNYPVVRVDMPDGRHFLLGTPGQITDATGTTRPTTASERTFIESLQRAPEGRALLAKEAMIYFEERLIHANQQTTGSGSISHLRAEFMLSPEYRRMQEAWANNEGEINMALREIDVAGALREAGLSREQVARLLGTQHLAREREFFYQYLERVERERARPQ